MISINQELSDIIISYLIPLRIESQNVIDLFFSHIQTYVRKHY